MKSYQRRRVLGLSGLTLLGLSAASWAAISSAFTFQATIRRDQNLVNSELCDCRFRLYDAAAGGNQIGVQQLSNGIQVNAGALTTLMDFGATVFDGADRYLEVDMKCGADVAFVTMLQRIRVTSAPAAIASRKLATRDLAGSTTDVGIDDASGRMIVTRQTLASTAAAAQLKRIEIDALSGSIAALDDSIVPNTASNLDFKYDNEVAMRITEDPGNPGQAVAMVGSGGLLLADEALANSEGQAAAFNTYSILKYDTGVNATVLQDGAMGSNRKIAWDAATGSIAALDGMAPAPFRWKSGPDTLLSYDPGDPADQLVVYKQGGIRGPKFVLGTAAAVAGEDPTAELSLNESTGDLELKVGAEIVDRWTPVGDTGVGFAPNRIGGNSSNQVAKGVFGAVIGGGGADGLANTVSGPYGAIVGGRLNTVSGGGSFIGGGYGNSASNDSCSIGGGAANMASGTGSTIAGGSDNNTSDDGAAVGGGFTNTASREYASVVGGLENTASGAYSVVVGGHQCEAGGNFSFAGGRKAHVRSIALGDADDDDGTFIWADAEGNDFISDGANKFLVRATGGTTFYSNFAFTAGVTLAAGGGSWSSVSDRNLKENVAEIDKTELLQKLAAIPVTTWNYKSQDPSIRHIGPMGQDFHEAFGVGETDTRLSTIDVDGVALAAIQGLHELVQEKDCQVEELGRRNAELESRLAALEALVNKTLTKNDESAR